VRETYVVPFPGCPVDPARPIVLSTALARADADVAGDLADHTSAVPVANRQLTQPPGLSPR
jgi:hypothetical protein